jgi:large repetitive protein
MSAYTPATATIAPGASQVFTATYTMTGSDVINGAGVTNGVSNTATARGTVSAGVFTSTAPSTATTSITQVAAVKVTKTAGTPTVAFGSNPTITDAGDTITYTYVVANSGSAPLTQAIPADAGPKFNGLH